MNRNVRFLLEALTYVWLGALAYSMLQFTDREAYLQAEISISLKLFSGVLVFIIGILLITKPKVIRASVLSDHGRALIAFVAILILLLSLVRMNLGSSVYAVLFLFMLIYTFICVDYLTARFYSNAAWLLIATILLAILIYGLPVGRWIGGIHPNIAGGFCLSATFFSMLSGKWTRLVIYAFAFAVSVLVESRYALIAISIIILSDVYTQTYRVRQYRLVHAALLFLMIMSVLTLGEFVASEILLVDSVERGSTSGFTGRTDLWGNFRAQFLEKPIFGYGFRQRDLYMGTHSGFADFILENGAIIGSIFLFFLIQRLLVLFRLAVRVPRAACFPQLGFILAWAFAGFFQPQIINFGDAYAVMTFFVFAIRPTERAMPWQAQQNTLKKRHAI